MSTRGPTIAPRTTLAPSPLNLALNASSPESASPGASNQSVPSIVTSREWVLPPRPKPGRKPSVDTPALKRKAQNRAAQRAFRERRATRVQELEQKLLEVEKEKEVKEMGLVNTINKLKFENQFLIKSIEQLKHEFASFRSSYGSPASPHNNHHHPQSAGPSPRPYHSQAQSQAQAQAHASGQQSQLYTTTGTSSAPRSQPPFHRGSQSSQSSQGSLAMLNANPQARASEYNLDVNQSAQHLLNFAKSLPANHSTGSPASLLYSVQQILPAPSADSPPTALLFRHVPPSKSTLISPTSQDATPNNKTAQNKNQNSNDDFDCGVCLKEQCLCEDIGLKSKPAAIEDQFNSFTPMAAVLLKSKKRSHPNENGSQEIDFTSEYAVKKMPDLKKLKKSPPASGKKVVVKKEQDTLLPINTSTFNEDSPVENCGFCSDDTPCVCREAAKEAARINESLAKKPEEPEQSEESTTSLPPLLNSSAMRKASLPVMHPGPTLEIREFTNLTPGSVPTVVTKDEKLEKLEQDDSESKSGCTGNPGTCAQCQTDPMSTLFCTTVASRAATTTREPSEAPEPTRPVLTRLSADSRMPASASPQENSDSAKGAESQGSTGSSRPNSFAPQTTPSTPLPTTPGGSTAGIFIPCADAYKTLSRHKRFNSVDFSSLVGKLTTRGMQVEVQSVANVLRELDRKVYD